jgi:cysteinyl-tRNA synthetase
MPLDIHGGGPDLKFPHHENEIAQSEGAFGGTLANVWMHCGPLMVDTEKMSKSLGNFRTIRETIATPDSLADQAEYQANPREAEMLRFFIVRNHYRSIQNYTPDNLRDAQNALDRLYQALANVPPATQTDIDWSLPAAAAFREAMDDDFNTSAAIAVLFELAGQANRDADAQAAALMRNLGGVLGLLQLDPQQYLRSSSRYLGQSAAQTLSDTEIDALVQDRANAKKARNFQQADAIRDQLKEAGIELEDKPGGVTQWRRA